MQRSVSLTSAVVAFGLAVVFAEEVPPVYVTVEFNVEPGDLCSLAYRFREKFARELLESRDGHVYTVPVTRIRFVNLTLRSCGTSDEHKPEGDDAALGFYVSKSESDSTVARDLTIRAYEILYDYWKNRKMIEIDREFIGKVKSVSLRGEEAPVAVKNDFTDEERVWIGIGFTLSFLTACGLVYAIVTCGTKLRRRVLNNAATRRGLEPVLRGEFPEGETVSVEVIPANGVACHKKEESEPLSAHKKSDEQTDVQSNDY